jgi:lactate permease
LDAGLAALPLAVALVVLLVLRRSAAVAGGSGALLALGLVIAPGPWGLAADRIGLAALRALLLTLLVAYVVFFGLLLYRLMARGGAIGRLAAALGRMPGDRAARALVLCLPLGAFFEAVSGFGLSIVVVAPLLVGMGTPPARAALLALMTQNAVPWGALAIGVVLSEEIGGPPAQAIGVGCAYLSAGLFPLYALLTTRLAGGRGWGLALLVAGLMGLAAWAGTVAFGVELGMVVGGPAVALVVVVLLRVRERARAASGEGTADGPSLARAAAPYVVLAGLLLASRLIAPARAWLLSTGVIEVEAVGFRMPLLYSPGFTLLLACAAAAALLGLSPRAVGAEIGGALRPWLRATLALVGFMLLAELMLQSGMTARLAGVTAVGLGPSYVLAAPVLGGLSGFMTGSNAAGSAMLLPFQLEVAAQIGVPALVMAAVQNTAASALSMASPQRVVLAAAVAGRPEDEPGLIRAALLVGVGAMVLITVGEMVWLGVT